MTINSHHSTASNISPNNESNNSPAIDSNNTLSIDKLKVISAVNDPGKISTNDSISSTHDTIGICDISSSDIRNVVSERLENPFSEDTREPQDGPNLNDEVFGTLSTSNHTTSVRKPDGTEDRISLYSDGFNTSLKPMKKKLIIDGDQMANIKRNSTSKSKINNKPVKLDFVEDISRDITCLKHESNVASAHSNPLSRRMVNNDNIEEHSNNDEEAAVKIVTHYKPNLARRKRKSRSKRRKACAKSRKFHPKSVR